MFFLALLPYPKVLQSVCTGSYSSLRVFRYGTSFLLLLVFIGRDFLFSPSCLRHSGQAFRPSHFCPVTPP